MVTALREAQSVNVMRKGSHRTMTLQLKSDYPDRLSAHGFSRAEINAIEFVLLRMGFLVRCEHERPKFVECYSADDDAHIHEQRWQKAMRETGFKPDAIRVAEHGLGICLLDCEICHTNGPVN